MHDDRLTDAPLAPPWDARARGSCSNEVRPMTVRDVLTITILGAASGSHRDRAHSGPGLARSVGAAGRLASPRLSRVGW